MTAADAISLAIAAGLSGAAATAILAVGFVALRRVKSTRRREQYHAKHRTPRGI